MTVIPPKESPGRKKQAPPLPLRFPPELLAEIQAIAKETGHSRNAVIKFLVQAGLEKYRAEQAKKKR